MSYRLHDVRRLYRDIKELLPTANVYWMDFGWALHVKLGNAACVACQPRIDKIGQKEIMRTPHEVARILGG